MNAIQEYSQTDAALAVLGGKYAGVTYAVETTAGMRDAVAARAEVRGYRVALEKRRVEIKAPALERCRLIDTEARRITAALTALEDPIDAQIKAEEARKEAVRQAAKRAEEERIAAKLRAEREAEERAAAEARAVEEARLAAEARAIEDAARAAREREESARRAAEEAAETVRRAAQREADDLADAQTMLTTFVARYGKRPEFAAVAKAIRAYLATVAKG